VFSQPWLCVIELDITRKLSVNQISIQIGQTVRHKDTGEIGIVVWVWNDEYGDTDTYVAFYGDEMPVGKPEVQPYVLRYNAGSLQTVEA